MSTETTDTTETTGPTGNETINYLIGWGRYLVVGFAAFWISMGLFVFMVDPLISEANSAFALVVWFAVSIYLIGKSRSRFM